MSAPALDDRRRFYETIADGFEGLDNPYDVARRVSVVFDELLAGEELRGKLVLDAGCGYGAFSRAGARRGARMVSADIGERLVRRSMANAGSRGVVADACCLAFGDESFEIVVSSEMIEHTGAAGEAIRELARVTRPGGTVVITTPNRRWQWLVRLASRLRLRPFQGIEQFVGWRELATLCAAHGLTVVKHVGFHAWPFRLPLWRLSRRVDARFGQSAWARVMINQAVLVRKARAIVVVLLTGDGGAPA